MGLPKRRNQTRRQPELTPTDRALTIAHLIATGHYNPNTWPNIATLFPLRETETAIIENPGNIDIWEHGTWRTADQPRVTVTTQRVVFHSGLGLRTWWWEHITSINPDGLHTIRFDGKTDKQQIIQWRIRTLAAETIFIVWALNQHRNHPALLTGTWKPAGWQPKNGNAPGASGGRGELG